jgi:hypothetical protein
MPPPPPYNVWFFRGLGDEPLMVQTFDAPRDAGWDVLDPMFVVAYLEGWLLDSEARTTLYDMHATLFGALATSAWGLGEEHLSLKPLLRRAFERQDLVALVPRRRSAQLPGQPTVPPPPPPPPPLALKTFIEIVLVNQEGKPVGGEAFQIILPDGSGQRGSLDRAGFARLDGLEPGVCDVSFPNIDGREWGKTLTGRLGRPKFELGAVPRGAPDTTADHVVKQGDDLFTIAASHGFRTWQTVYFDESNTDLRAIRVNPAILFPGDIVKVPAKQSKQEDAVTGARHQFFVEDMRRELRLRMVDPFGRPFAGESYSLSIDGNAVGAGKLTDREGFLTASILPSARAGRISIRSFVWDFEIAKLNPMTHVPGPDTGISGAKGRLFNLGYDVERIDHQLDQNTQAALRLFQAAHKLSVTGTLDAATIAMLEQVHGS